MFETLKQEGTCSGNGHSGLGFSAEFGHFGEGNVQRGLSCLADLAVRSLPVFSVSGDVFPVEQRSGGELGRSLSPLSCSRAGSATPDTGSRNTAELPLCLRALCPQLWTSGKIFQLKSC